MSTSRRSFLTTAAGLGALAAIPRPARASEDAPVAKQPAFLISLAEWSYHKALQAGKLDHRDFAKVAKQDHHIEAVEFVNSFFKDKARDGAYLKDVRSRADDLGVRILLIMCDGEGELGHADDGERAKAVENHVKWLEAAKRLGCHSIRVNAGGSGPRAEHAARAADSLHKLGELAAPMDLCVIVENHGGPSSDGTWLSGVMRQAAHPRVGTLPDFGNFRVSETEQYDRYKGVEELMPFAKAVSAKTYDFDDKGEETTIDYARMMKIVTRAGYHGHLGIEYEGSRLSEKDGVDATKRLLERVRSQLA
ncbi:MAG: sugar phosphate isomerase/epimerase [Planctomycetota bacterium]|nr:sugar phosphate isomerase/epimerase [Planctomycetota bacterium]